MGQPAPRLAVIGLGSVLMGDDAAGPYFIKIFEAAYEYPEELSVLDLGTELTPEVQATMPKIEDIVLQELGSWGITPVRKPSTQHDIWWSR